MTQRHFYVFISDLKKIFGAYGVQSDLRDVSLEKNTNIQANSVNIKCCPFKLIAIPFCKTIIDALGQGAHCLVSFFIIKIEQIIV